MRDYEEIERAADDMLERVVKSRYTAAIITALAIIGVVALLRACAG